jgi:hypothetical protein
MIPLTCLTKHVVTGFDADFEILSLKDCGREINRVALDKRRLRFNHVVAKSELARVVSCILEKTAPDQEAGIFIDVVVVAGRGNGSHPPIR